MFQVRHLAASSVTIIHAPEKPVAGEDLFADRLVFVWDRLIDPAETEKLLGRPVPFAPAALPGFERNSRRDGDEWEYELAEEEGAIVLGAVLLGITEEELEIIDDYESVPIHRTRHKAKVRIGDLERVADLHLRRGSYLDE